MIVTKTPLRISLGGGGTDLPAYYVKYGGEWISAAIDKYVYVCVHPSPVTWFYHRGKVSTNNDIINKAVSLINRDSVEIMSSADLPPGTGLGSSSSFTVGLVHALTKSLPGELAELACRIEMSLSACGKQDQYAAALGGINHYEIDRYGKVDITPVKFDHKLFNRQLLMFSLGTTRQANDILHDQQSNIETTANYLHKIRGLGVVMYEALEANDFDTVGIIMDEHWKEKKKISPKMSNSVIDNYYSKAKEAGALGGKIIGAGGGGFMLIYAPEKKHLQIMAAVGLDNIDFKFDFEGSKRFEI